MANRLSDPNISGTGAALLVREAKRWEAGQRNARTKPERRSRKTVDADPMMRPFPTEETPDAP